MKVNMTEEVWKPIPGYEGKYEVSNLGRLKGLPKKHRNRYSFYYTKEKILKPCKHKSGYYHVTLCDGEGSQKNRPIHQLVLEAFVGPRPSGMEVRHLDGNSINNRLDNLEYDTHKKNMEDCVRHGVLPYGENHSRAILTEAQVKEIKESKPWWGRGRYFSKKFGVDDANISWILKGEGWKEVQR